MSDYKHWTMEDAIEELRRSVLKEREAMTKERDSLPRRIDRAMRGVEAGSLVRTKRLEDQLAAVTKERDELRSLAQNRLVALDHATERLNHAEEILDELSSGYWLSVFEEHGDGDMGQRVMAGL